MARIIVPHNLVASRATIAGTGSVNGGEADDWSERSTGPGVLRAVRFSNSSEVNAAKWPDVRVGNLSFDATNGPGGNGCAKIAVNNADGTNNGAYMLLIADDGRTFGPAQANKRYYMQCRQKSPEVHVYNTFPGSGANSPFADGIKHFIAARDDSSSGGNAIVCEDELNQGTPGFYWYNGGYTNNWVYVGGAVNGYRRQPAVDNGGAATTVQDCRNRYGAIVLADGSDRNTGTPILPMGGFYHAAEEWQTFEICVDFTNGLSDVLLEMWWAHDGEAPVKISESHISLGDDRGGHNAIWLTCYDTGRTSNGGINTETFYAEFITSTDPVPFPGGYQIDSEATTALEEAFDLAADAWGTLTLSNRVNTDAGGTGDNMYSYSPKLTWNPINKEINYYCGNHGNDNVVQRLWIGVINTFANGWVPNNPPIGVEGGLIGQITHGFCAGTTDMSTGDVYYTIPYGQTNTIYKYTRATGVFSTLPSRSGTNNQCLTLDYHPGLYNGAGGLIAANQWEIQTLNLGNPSAGWTRIVNAPSGNVMDSGGFGVSCYCVKDGSVYLGGGTYDPVLPNAGDPVPLWRIPASSGAGTATQITLCPMELGIWADDAESLGCVFDSGLGGNMMAINGQGYAYEYVAASNTWNDLGLVLPTGCRSNTNGGSLGTMWLAGGPVYGQGVVFTPALTIGVNGSSPTLYLWKK